MLYVVGDDDAYVRTVSNRCMDAERLVKTQ